MMRPGPFFAADNENTYPATDDPPTVCTAERRRGIFVTDGQPAKEGPRWEERSARDPRTRIVTHLPRSTSWKAQIAKNHGSSFLTSGADTFQKKFLKPATKLGSTLVEVLTRLSRSIGYPAFEHRFRPALLQCGKRDLAQPKQIFTRLH
jgi:hypothetical protein